MGRSADQEDLRLRRNAVKCGRRALCVEERVRSHCSEEKVSFGDALRLLGDFFEYALTGWRPILLSQTY